MILAALIYALAGCATATYANDKHDDNMSEMEFAMCILLWPIYLWGMMR